MWAVQKCDDDANWVFAKKNPTKTHACVHVFIFQKYIYNHMLYKKFIPSQTEERRKAQHVAPLVGGREEKVSGFRNDDDVEVEGYDYCERLFWWKHWEGEGDKERRTNTDTRETTRKHSIRRSRQTDRI